MAAKTPAKKARQSTKQVKGATVRNARRKAAPTTQPTPTPQLPLQAGPNTTVTINGLSGPSPDTGGSRQNSQLTPSQLDELLQALRQILEPIPAAFEELQRQMMYGQAMAARGMRPGIPQAPNNNVALSFNDRARDLAWMYHKPGVNNISPNPLVHRAQAMVDDEIQSISGGESPLAIEQAGEVVMQLAAIRKKLDAVETRLEEVSKTPAGSEVEVDGASGKGAGEADADGNGDKDNENAGDETDA